MGQSNSYFQLDLRPNGTYVKIFPPKEGGQFIRVNELTAYLNSHGCDQFDLRELNQAVFSNQLAELRVGKNDGIAINEMMSVTVSPDGMRAECRFFPPSEGGSKMSAQEIIKDLQYQGIHTGIDQDKILLFLNERLYCTNYVLAEGTPPLLGRDAEIIYNFQTDVSLRPKTNEDGSVDYHELGTISHVKAGELLATLVPEDPGELGLDVYGHEIKPPTVKTKKLLYGKNITASEDGLKIYSDVTGHASLVNGQVFVSDIYEVPADVDNSIGNIDYQGNVWVRGNVKGGFSIHAKGDIVVEGVVEDAVLYASGQIIVKRGIHGKNKGVLNAEGNIICKFIESATVQSGGYVETDSILHSQVSAVTEIRVSGKKGFITGGVIRAGSLVEAKTIGSEMGAQTKIEVGIEPARKERYVWVQKSLVQVQRDIDQIKPVLVTYTQKMNSGEQLSPQKAMYVQQLAGVLQGKKKDYTNLKEEYDKLHQEITQSDNARVKIRKTIFPGVTVGVTDVSLTLKDERSYCQLLKREGEVVIDTL